MGLVWYYLNKWKLENNTNIRRTFEQREQRDEYFCIFSNIYVEEHF